MQDHKRFPYLLFQDTKSKAPNGLLWGRVDFASAIDGQRAMNEVDGDRAKGGLRVREFKPMGNRSVGVLYNVSLSV